MVFVPAAHYLWDFWLAPRTASGEYHLFYLQAPRNLPHPALRHEVATVGHAVSRDLVHWQERGTALAAGPAGAWDDRAIWTGSITKHRDLYYWFYTGTNLREGSRGQRIGLATSPALINWERFAGNPLLEPDPRWYATASSADPWGGACRDPCVVAAEGEDAFYLFFTATAREGLDSGRGVIGMARSLDLRRWEHLGPVTRPWEFGELEVPQPLKLAGRWYLLFCTGAHSPRRLLRTGLGGKWMGTHYLVADELAGPYRLIEDDGMVADAAGTYYAGRVVTRPDGAPIFLAWRQWDERGAFLGGLSNPAPLRALSDGRLRVETAALWPR